MSPFLRLPRELRDLVYEYYLRCDGGYVNKPGTWKLLRADGGPICYALALTCHQIADELEGLAFEINDVTFSVVHTAVEEEQVAFHHSVLGMLQNAKSSLMKQVAPELFTHEMAHSAAKKYPQFAELIDLWMSLGDMSTLWGFKRSLGEAPSVWYDFVQYILDLISTHPAFDQTLRALPPRFSPVLEGRNPLELVDSRLQPWSIVDFAELRRLADILYEDSKMPRWYTKTEHSYSASATAIRFLTSCTQRTRSHIRKVILIEDEVSVAQPECHGRGFISLCQENAQLQIERRVNLWKSVWPLCETGKMEYMEGAESYMDREDMKADRLPARDVTRTVAPWLMETMVLPSLGMPEGSYKLVLDGNPTPEHTSDVFRIVQRDAAWQAALDESYSRSAFPEPASWLDRRRRSGFIFEGLPSVIDAISTEGSLVRCNFELSTPYDVEAMLEEHRGWAIEQWEQKWWEHEPLKFQTEPPLPQWHILRWQHVLD